MEPMKSTQPESTERQKPGDPPVKQEPYKPGQSNSQPAPKP
jgi:hypothetical protein